VTGTNPSNIFGTLGVSGGNANLFLINPNGIIFGQNARLEVGGSFVASTASSLNFADGTQFSATAPQTTPLLTVSVPIGLQFGRTAGSIRNRSQATNRDGDIVGLQVQPGKTLALVGGNVSLDGGNMQAPGGRVELGGVAGSGTVGMNVDGNNLSLSFPDEVARADVSLTNDAFVDVSAGDGGSITINARNLDILASSELVAGIREGLGTVGSQAGDITLNATEAITIGQSSIINEVGDDAIGNGGDINIKAGSLLLTDSAQLSTTTLGQGNGGSILVRTNGDVSFSHSYIDSYTAGKGDGGSISVQANGDVSVANLSKISTGTSGQGNAGSISVQANDNISVSGDFIYIPDGFGGADVGELSYIASSTDGQGDAGSVSVQANGNVSIADSGIYSETDSQGNAGSVLVQANSNVSIADSFISTVTRGQGDGGSVSVQANGNVSLFGIFENSPVNGVITSLTGGQGKGGDIHIRARSLSLTDASRLTAETFEIYNSTDKSGNAGNIYVDAVDSVTLSGITNFGGRPSAFFTNTNEGAGGQGGDITVRTGILRILNGAVLSAATRSDYNGGNIKVDVNTLEIRGGGQILTTTFSSGQAGSITVNTTGSITLSGSDPTYFDRLTGSFATLNVATASPASGVFANTNANSIGNGGTIELNTTNLTISDGAEVSVSSEGLGNAGILQVKADAIRLDNEGKIRADTSGGGGNINLYTANLILRRGSSISTNATGSNITGGNITIDTDNLVAVPKEDSDISANAENSFGGRVIVNAQGIFGTQFRPQDTPLSDITASSALGPQFNGVVQLNTPGIDPSRGLANLPTEVVDASNQIAQTCGARGAEVGKNEFIVTGRRGMPSNPYEPLSNDEALEDIHPPSELSSSRNSKPVAARSVTPQSATSNPKPPIVEAQGWVINDRGQVVLTATASSATPHNSLPASATCPSS
jgi:large exoprotein involved in heme utilization and adhesion